MSRFLKSYGIFFLVYLSIATSALSQKKEYKPDDIKELIELAATKKDSSVLKDLITNAGNIKELEREQVIVNFIGSDEAISHTDPNQELFSLIPGVEKNEVEITGNIATVKGGSVTYVNIRGTWHKIPAENNVEFYKYYLRLGGKDSIKREYIEADIIDLLDKVQTDKDYQDAVDLIKDAKNFKVLRKNGIIREKVVDLAGNFSIKNPLWAESLWGIVFMAFSFGFAALLTPCVFPLIPMTVTFFMKEGKGKGIRDALIYGLSIVLIYTILGVAVSYLFGAQTANMLATSAGFNIAFFIIFMIFAASFLGMFEITLPSWLVNRIDRQADKGGFLGPFFMAFTLVLVSFSCTGPIVGSVLVEAADGQFLKPIVAMLSFGTAIAIPFTLFAIFPDWLSGLPKSGGWLNSVKVVLGFVEIALGLKFLSVADQVYGWGLLDREIYLSIWIAIFALITAYLLGKFRLPNDSETTDIGVPRLMLALLSFSFVIYMLPGLWGAPLKELTGYLPPMSTQEDYHVTESIVRDVVLEIMEDQNPTDISNRLCHHTPKYSDHLHLPHGLKGYFELNEALECAQEQNKPLFIDFTGHGCVNCRKMEEQVWKDPKVLGRLRKDYIMVALYCDDKKIDLTENEWVRSKFDTTEILKTVGEINQEYQMATFGSASQPLYVLMGPDGKALPGVETRNYDLDIDAFIQFLDKGKKSFEEKFGKAK